MADQQPGVHRADEPQPGPISPLVALVAVILVLGLLGAGVALALAGWSTEQISGLLIALATVAGVLLTAVGKLMADHRSLVVKQDKQTALLQKVDNNTNGNLQRIVDDAVQRSVAKAFQDKDFREGTNGSGQKGIAA